MFKLDPQTEAAIAAAEKVLAAYAQIDEAVSRAVREAEEATRRADVDMAALAALDAESLLATTDAGARAAEKQTARAAATAAESRAVADRKQRILTAIKAKRSEAEAAIAAEQIVLQSEVNLSSETVLVALSVELVQAAQPIVEVLRRAAVLRLATHNRTLGQSLAEVNIPHLALYGQEVVRSDRVSIDGISTLLLANWQENPRLVAEHDEIARPRLALQALQRFSTAAQREREALARVPRSTGYSTHGINRGAAQPSARAEITATPRMGSAPVLDANMGARVLDDPDFAFHR